MGRKPTGKPNGRPLRDFDQQVFEGLCHICCTWGEMENVLKCNRDTLDHWCQRVYEEGFRDVYNRLSDGGKASLRRNQLNLSKTSAAMCIWLGKQWLGQKDDPSGDKEMNGELKEYVGQLRDMLKNKLQGKEEKVTDYNVPEEKTDDV